MQEPVIFSGLLNINGIILKLELNESYKGGESLERSHDRIASKAHQDINEG